MAKSTTITTPKDIFLRLFHIVTFYLMVTSIITLFSQYIDVLFPDTLYYYFTGVSESIRFSTSMLIITTPAYLISSWLLQRDIKKEPGKKDLGIVKWLVYFTLFVSAMTIIIDLITFVYNFMSGELTMPFFLKIIIVLLIAVAVFSFFLWDLHHKPIHTKTRTILAWILSIAVFVSIACGFMIIGTPAQQRDRRMDEQRINHLQQLQGELITYWTQKATLPSTLLDVEDSISGFTIPVDPETKEQYEYVVTSPLSLKLCATFHSVSDDHNPANKSYASPYGAYQQNWSHQDEYTCFEREIDPELYATQQEKESNVPPIR